MVDQEGRLSRTIKRERRPTLSLAAVSGRRNRNALLGGVEHYLLTEEKRSLQRWTDALLDELARFEMRRRRVGLFGGPLSKADAERLLKCGEALLDEGRLP